MREKFKEATAKDMERFGNRYVEVAGPLATPCWLWKPNEKHNEKGYAYFWFDGKWRRAHIFSWQQKRKRTVRCDRYNRKLVLDHMCNRRNCVNPEHTQEVTQSMNLLMIYRRGSDSFVQPVLQIA